MDSVNVIWRLRVELQPVIEDVQEFPYSPPHVCYRNEAYFCGCIAHAHPELILFLNSICQGINSLVFNFDNFTHIKFAISFFSWIFYSLRHFISKRSFSSTFSSERSRLEALIKSYWFIPMLVENVLGHSQNNSQYSHARGDCQRFVYILRPAAIQRCQKTTGYVLESTRLPMTATDTSFSAVAPHKYHIQFVDWLVSHLQWPLLLIWFNSNPSMDR